MNKLRSIINLSSSRLDPTSNCLEGQIIKHNPSLSINLTVFKLMYPSPRQTDQSLKEEIIGGITWIDDGQVGILLVTLL